MKKLIPILIFIIIVFCLPFSKYGYDITWFYADFRQCKMIMYLLCFYIPACGIVWKYNKYMSMFLGLSALSIFNRFSNENLISLFFVTGAIFSYCAIRHYKPDPEKVFKWIRIGCLTSIGVSLFLFYVVPWLLKGSGWTFFINLDGRVGLMGNPNMQSILIAACFPAFMDWKSLKYIPFLIWGLVIAHSMGGPVSLAVGLLFMTAMVGRYVFISTLVLSAACLTGYYFHVDDFTIVGRISLWFYGIERWLEAPWFGHGLNGFSDLHAHLEPAHPKNWTDHVHNEYIEAMVNLGVFVLVPIFGFLYSTAKKAYYENSRQVAGIIIIATNCIFNFSLHIGPIVILFMAYAAMVGGDDAGQTTEIKMR